MNIVIPLAGHSRRFKAAGYTSPKAFIDVLGEPMISKVIDMFSANDRFFFIMNQNQYDENPEYFKILKNLVPRSEVIVVSSHELGPIYSCLQVKNIDNDGLIIAYCDFFVDWDYEKFIRFVRNHDAAISTFRGFHPASFGNTFYAYIKAEGSKFLELREKQSFTENRSEEPASTGIYYFRNFEMFRKYAEITLENLPNLSLKEGYVSLLYNFMQEDGLDIVIQDVERFICLGTPEDLEQYLFWGKYFQSENTVSNQNKKISTHQTNLIPMAGKGSRFKESGYRVTKPLIQVHKKPMAVAACESFPNTNKWIYLVRDTELNKHPIERALRNFSAECKVISVNQDTSGQAATCLLAKELLNPEDSLFIASCDYKMVYNSEKWESLISDPTIDGVIWTNRLKSNLFKNPNAFAYCKTDLKGKNVTEVVEKKTISNTPQLDPMVVGSFWYRKASSFIYAAEEMIKKNITVNGEHYVGTSINLLIEKGERFVIFDIDQWISFGDPFELQVFEYWQDHFYKRKLINVSKK